MMPMKCSMVSSKKGREFQSRFGGDDVVNNSLRDVGGCFASMVSWMCTSLD